MLKKTILVVALIALMPSPPNDGAAPEPQGNAFAYVAAAADTFADVKGFCSRNPAVCVTANQFAVTVEAKARYSAKLLYEWANEASETPTAALNPLPRDMAALDALTTSSVSARQVAMESQSTLTLEDLIPEWQAPQG